MSGAKGQTQTSKHPSAESALPFINGHRQHGGTSDKCRSRSWRWMGTRWDGSHL